MEKFLVTSKGWYNYNYKLLQHPIIRVDGSNPGRVDQINCVSKSSSEEAAEGAQRGKITNFDI